MSTPRPPADDRTSRLSESDAEMLTVYVAELSAARLPLAPGLRAAAAESSGRLAAALRRMADALDQGRPLEEVLQERAAGFPRYLQGMVAAALRTGQLGETLIELIEHHRIARHQRWLVVFALTYPVVLLLLAGVMFLGFSLVAADLGKVAEEFQFQLPLVSMWILWVGRYGGYLIGGMLLGGLAVLGVLRVSLGAERWRRLVAATPLFGPLWHWSAVAEMARLLAILLRRRVPLPEAFRLTAAGVNDANVAGVCREFAHGVNEGRDVALLFAMSPRVPASLAPLVRWGDATGRLGEAFQAAAEMLEGRVRLRATLLRTILPPFLFLVAASLVLTLLVGVFGPMIALLQNLT